MFKSPLTVVRAAIDHALAQGVDVAPFTPELHRGTFAYTFGLAIVSNRYVVSGNGPVDALGCLLLGRRTLQRTLRPQVCYQEAAILLDVSLEWVVTMGEGFSDNVLERPEMDWPTWSAWTVGQELRRELGWPLGDAA